MHEFQVMGINAEESRASVYLTEVIVHTYLYALSHGERTESRHLVMQEAAAECTYRRLVNVFLIVLRLWP